MHQICGAYEMLFRVESVVKSKHNFRTQLRRSVHSLEQRDARGRQDRRRGAHHGWREFAAAILNLAHG